MTFPVPQVHQRRGQRGGPHMVRYCLHRSLMLMHMVPGPSAPGQPCNSAAPFRVACHLRHSHCLTGLSFTARPCHARQAVAAEAAPEAGPKKLWGGRFTGKTDPLMEKFNESLPFDKRMWAEDIRVRAVAGRSAPLLLQSSVGRRSWKVACCVSVSGPALLMRSVSSIDSPWHLLVTPCFHVAGLQHMSFGRVGAGQSGVRQGAGQGWRADG